MSFLLKSSSRLFLTQQVRNKFRLSGIYPAVVTPFKTTRSGDNGVDLYRFELLLRHLNRYPLGGFALLGSAGEASSLSSERKLELVSHARRYLGKHRTILAGAGLESTDDTVELVQQMARAGADACFVYNPSYFRDRMDSEAYLDHFRHIADNSPVPIILYNIPAHIDVDIPIDVVVALAKHPNIAGLFDTGGNITRIATICKQTAEIRGGKTFDVMAGSAGFFLAGLMVGCKGAICSLASLLPFEMITLQSLLRDAQLEKAQKLQWRLLEPNEAVTTKFGVAGLKAMLKTYVGIDTGSVRSPLRNLSPEEVDQCLNMFIQNGFLLENQKLAQEQNL